MVSRAHRTPARAGPRVIRRAVRGVHTHIEGIRDENCGRVGGKAKDLRALCCVTTEKCNNAFMPFFTEIALLRSLSSVPLSFLATFRYRASSLCFVRLVSLLMPLSFSGALALIFLSWL